MADVYAGDDDLSNPDSPARVTATYDFNVTADTQPDVVARIANQFSFANEAPLCFEFSAYPDGTARARIRIAAVTPELADVVARKLSGLTCVNGVIVTPVTAAEPATSSVPPASAVAPATTM